MYSARITGTTANDQEIILNPFEHNHFNPNAQITINAASAASVLVPTPAENVPIIIATPNATLRYAGVQ